MALRKENLICGKDGVSVREMYVVCGNPAKFISLKERWKFNLDLLMCRKHIGRVLDTLVAA